jgi:hypothetical protein
MPHEDAIYPTTKLSKNQPGGAGRSQSQSCLLIRSRLFNNSSSFLTEETARNQHFKTRLNSLHHLGLNKVGKSEFTPFENHRQHHRRKNPFAFLTDWDLASREEATRNVAESSDSFVVFNYMKTRIADKGAGQNYESKKYCITIGRSYKRLLPATLPISPPNTL